MHPDWLGVISVIVGFVYFFATYRAAPNTTTRTRGILTMAAVALAIPGASFALYYVHFFPEPSWYYHFRSLPGMELLLVFIGVAGGLVASFMPVRCLFFLC
jgi:hypothetical protein